MTRSAGKDEFQQHDRVQWVDDDGVGHMGYVMANLSMQYLIRPVLESHEGECFVFKSNRSLKRSF